MARCPWYNRPVRMVRLGVIPRSRTVSLPVMGLVATAVLTLAFGSMVALMLAPAAALLMLLAHGIAPGEKLIERLRRRFVGVRRRAALRLPHRRLTLVVRRVGRRLEAALAMRPPPAAHVLLSHR
jgi:hypothetical protein